MSQLADYPLLFDENLAARITGALTDLHPGSLHVRDAGLLGASDRAIWQHARENGFVIVSKDEDFHRLSMIHGPPPKIIWIRLGNCSTDDVIRLLRYRRSAIQEFLVQDDAAFLALA